MRLVLSIVAAAVAAWSCGTSVARCTPANCNGCCEADAGCQAGDSTSSCGRDGKTCAPCTGGKTCMSGVCFGGFGGGTGGGSAAGGTAGGAAGGSGGASGGASGGTAGGTAGGAAGGASCGFSPRADHLLINEISVATSA